MNYLYVILFLLGGLTSAAQDPFRLTKQVKDLSEKEYDFNSDKKVVVFTGSSSVVRWKSVQSDFPDYNVINNGFGGSQFSDLLYFYDELIPKHKPDILFIYEGDNDVARDKKISKIYRQAKELHRRIRQDLPETRVVFISPKPCISNWNKKDNYLKLNKKLYEYCRRQKNLEFADVWSEMVDENGVVFQDIFVADGDHMNAKGYAIWVKVIGEFLQ